mgnify:CR=1 FL=1
MAMRWEGGGEMGKTEMRCEGGGEMGRMVMRWEVGDEMEGGGEVGGW